MYSPPSNVTPVSWPIPVEHCCFSFKIRVGLEEAETLFFQLMIEYQTPPLRFLHGDIGFSWQGRLQTTQRNVYSSAVQEEPGGLASQPRETLP